MQELERCIFGDLDLRGEKECLAGRCAGIEEGPQASAQQTFSFGRRQLFEFRRSHRRSLFHVRRAAVSAEIVAHTLPRLGGRREACRVKWWTPATIEWRRTRPCVAR